MVYGVYRIFLKKKLMIQMMVIGIIVVDTVDFGIYTLGINLKKKNLNGFKGFEKNAKQKMYASTAVVPLPDFLP